MSKVHIMLYHDLEFLNDLQSIIKLICFTSLGQKKSLTFQFDIYSSHQSNISSIISIHCTILTLLNFFPFTELILLFPKNIKELFLIVFLEIETQILDIKWPPMQNSHYKYLQLPRGLFWDPNVTNFNLCHLYEMVNLMHLPKIEKTDTFKYILGL